MSEKHKVGQDGVRNDDVSRCPADTHDLQNLRRCCRRDGTTPDAGTDTAHQGKDVINSSTYRLCRATLTALLAFPLIPGCQSAMSQTESHASTKPPNEFPLTFKEHNFNAYCYSTIGCSVIYANQQQSAWSGPDEVTPPPESPNYREEWQGTHAGIRNFPPPAVVRWRSLDGVAHEAKVDIGAIFKDERVLHRVPEADYAERSFGGSPDIILEVNDRTISVYMSAFVATKTLQRPGNEHSNFRADLIVAWSHAY